MKPERSPYLRMGITLLSLIGLFDAAYLSISRLQSRSLLCVVGSGCDVVQASPWSTLPPGGGVPVAFIGLAGYVALFVLGMVSLQKDRIGAIPLPTTLLAISSIGVVFSAFLMYLQFFVIKSVCFWCTLSALFQLCIWVAALLDWRAWR